MTHLYPKYSVVISGWNTNQTATMNGLHDRARDNRKEVCMVQHNGLRCRLTASPVPMFGNKNNDNKTLAQRQKAVAAGALVV